MTIIIDAKAMIAFNTCGGTACVAYSRFTFIKTILYLLKTILKFINKCDEFSYIDIIKLISFT